MDALILHLPPTLRLSHEQYEQLAVANPNLRIEMTASGEIIAMPPTGGTSGQRNADLTFQLQLWSRQNPIGVVFDSSTEFKLPNGAYRSPDASWISRDRWNALTPEEQETFPPICPDLVVALRSKTDRLKTLQEKMLEYQENGCRLGWLINPQDREVEVYRVGQEKEVLREVRSVSGEDVLPGFELDLQVIFG
ncbi:Uma2 family endonuclease [Leptolyngbya ohadii]|uniref:Uma2 family endonuclease n=1 Tax=Leptolyngbya ohadii TaxID=1962290 RepID=UPI000B59C9B3|nr:Uma2 family endonuclease [Leptolyngbya ohadii]